MRAGTSLGNILLNVLISEGIPVERVGKNNVMVRNENKQKGSVCYLFDKQVICLPNPPIDLKVDPQPTTFLIRFSKRGGFFCFTTFRVGFPFEDDPVSNKQINNTRA